MAKETYEFDFSYDDGNWIMETAHIGDGVLHIDDLVGYGKRSPDASWDYGTNDNFEIEIDVKSDAINGTVHWAIYLNLVGDDNAIVFEFKGLATDEIQLHYPIGTLRASQHENIDDTNWHTVKIRRVGTTYYLSVDGGAEISYDYGTPRALNNIVLSYIHVTGSFDNFKYFWWPDEDYAFIT